MLGTQPWGGDDYFLDANGFASEPQFDHDAARQRIVQYRKEAAARRRRQMLKAEKQAVAMRAELPLAKRPHPGPVAQGHRGAGHPARRSRAALPSAAPAPPLAHTGGGSLSTR